MSQEYLLLRKAALLARADETDADIEKTIGQLASVNLAVGSTGTSDGGSVGGGSTGGSVDTSTLAKEITATAINSKLPALSGGRVPIVLPTVNLTADWRVLTANTTIPAGSCYVYLKVILGDVTINGLTKTTGQYLNLEPSPFARHPEIVITIPAGKSVELVRGY